MTDLVTLMEQSWPAARSTKIGAVTLRDGAGGGQRVSAATAAPGWSDADLLAAEAAMGAQSLFMLRPHEDALDSALAVRGYQIKDPVVVYAAPCADIAQPGPAFMSTFPHWPPLQIARHLWAEGHIGPPRLKVMDRVQGPKTTVLGRANDRAAGVGFAALVGSIAFVHALYVTPDQRRQGMARNLMQACAAWAQGQGADRIALAVTRTNDAARAGYAALGMQVVDGYHYRVRAQ